MDLEVPTPLIDDIGDGRCLPFVGAGFSLNAEIDQEYSMPDWSGLADHLRQLAKMQEPLEGPDAAAAYERRFGRVNLIDAVRRSLNPGHVKPGAAHRALALLPFDTIYTTNFDLLLEDALAAINKPYRSLVGEQQLPFHAGQYITNVVKMHGDIRHEEHFVITRQDYNDFLMKYPVIATHLSAMLIVRTPLFLGYSRTDSDFLQIQEVIQSRLGPFRRMPYIVQFDVELQEIESGFDQQTHIINLSTDSGLSRKEALANFFTAIQGELDARAGKSMRKSDPEAFEEVEPVVLDRTYRSPDAADLLEGSSSLCFVTMPFAREYDDTYYDIIRPAAEQVGLTPIRASEIRPPGTLSEQVRAAIRESRVCIAEITSSNEEIHYELGLAHSLGKPVVVMTRQWESVPIELRRRKVITYDPENVVDARASLIARLQAELQVNKLDDAQALVSGGMHRAAVAVLGVIVEHALRAELYRRDIRMTRKFKSALQMAGALVDAAAIDVGTFHAVRGFATIRNRAVHELQEPSVGDADEALDLVRRILRDLGDDSS